MAISLIAGLVYGVRLRGRATSDRLVGGLIASAVCALIGIVVSWMLHDVTAPIRAFGTLSSGVTGAIGGGIGRLVTRDPVATSSP